MPKSTLFKHLTKTNKKVESPRQLSPSLPTNANPVVIQQTNTKDISAPIANDPTHSSENTETQPTLILADRITEDPMKKPSTSITKPSDNVSEIQTLPSQLKDPQHISSYSLVADTS